MGTVREWQLFIMGLLWGLILFRFAPSFFKDLRKMWLEIRTNEKNPADGTAERNKKNITKYSITNSCTDFHSQNLEKWS
ncbi:hypothetical protein DFR79_106117 [Halanaerobium saccharolyticum]|jgi:hypothetical protein|uniref:Uncharacterized protein n=1 Tax=Halanaerobium saccharolyticum TaxID=43595 RepID=A0A4R6LUI9_9FIRM|nr:hypothetical protein [Halanaerobium saccharolyticum]TDO92304.1 hypothetical protein DFR79_106117 [Halanaerobium saccharolyticum]